MTTNNAEALRLADHILCGLPSMHITRNELIAALEMAIASQPQAAGAGGDAVQSDADRVAKALAMMEGRLHVEGRHMRYARTAVNALAATPAPAVEREADREVWRYSVVSALEYLRAGDTENAIGMLDSALAVDDISPPASAYTTPPAEARDPDAPRAEAVESDRCRHGVWSADHCYSCERETVAPAPAVEADEEAAFEAWIQRHYGGYFSAEFKRSRRDAWMARAALAHAAPKAAPAVEAWTCEACGQRNAGWATVCGRCDLRPLTDGERAALAHAAPPEAEFKTYVKARTTAIRVASEMQAWAEKKMTGPGSSRIDRTVMREWAAQLLGDDHVD